MRIYEILYFSHFASNRLYLLYGKIVFWMIVIFLRKMIFGQLELKLILEFGILRTEVEYIIFNFNGRYQFNASISFSLLFFCFADGGYRSEAKLTQKLMNVGEFAKTDYIVDCETLNAVRAVDLIREYHMILVDP